MSNIEELHQFIRENDDGDGAFELFLALLLVAGRKMRGAQSADEFLGRLTPAETIEAKRLAAGGKSDE